MAIGSRSNKLRVAVLMGGLSSERDISLSTGSQVLKSLDRSRYEAYGVDAALMPGSLRNKDLGAECEIDAVNEAGRELSQGTDLYGMDVLLGTSKLRPDVVLIALHGKYGEDGCVQGLLEILGLPYTGSGVLASALAMDKSMSKKIMASAGILVPDSFEVSRGQGSIDWKAVLEQAQRLGYPLIVKPSRQGSTIGMRRAYNSDKLLDCIEYAFRYDSLAVVEKLIEGTEVTVSVLGNAEPSALPVIEIVPSEGFYDYQAKYTPGATEEIVPARIGKEATDAVQELAVRAHKALGCRGVCRVDFIFDGMSFYALEVNTIPGMTPTSLLPKAAAAAGIGFENLLDKLIELALENAEVVL